MRYSFLAAVTAAVAAVGMTAGSASAQDCPIKIGGMAPLSAPGTVVGGEAMRDAMLIAEEDINARGGLLGCEVDVVIGDTEGLPEKGAALMEKFITQDNVVAVGGGYHSSVGVASKDVADARGVPVVFAETWNDTITGDKQRYIFRIAPLSSWASSTIWKHALEIPGVQKVAILTENTDYGIPAAEETRKGLEGGGKEVVTFSVDIGTQDYAGIVQRMKAENPDMIIVLATGEAGYNFQQQASDAGIGSQDIIFHAGQVSLESKAYWENVPDGLYAFREPVHRGRQGLRQALQGAHGQGRGRELCDGGLRLDHDHRPGDRRGEFDGRRRDRRCARGNRAQRHAGQDLLPLRLQEGPERRRQG